MLRTQKECATLSFSPSVADETAAYKANKNHDFLLHIFTNIRQRMKQTRQNRRFNIFPL